jgi:hypothetical protein
MREMGKSLREIESWLERSLQEDLPSIGPVKIHCAVGDEIFFISVHVIESTALSPSIVLPLVQKKVMNGGILPHYPLETYFIAHGKDAFNTLATSALVPLVPAFSEKRSFSGSNRALVASILGFFAALGFLYAFTRPCSRGSCPEIDRAWRLTERAVTVVDSDPIAARADLSRSIALLSSIPPWSPYRDRALTLQTHSRQKADDLDRILAIVDNAGKLTDGTPVDRLEAIRQRWRDSIDRLEGFPADSAFYPFTRREIDKYRFKLTAIEQRIDRERRGILKLENARQAAKLATQREKNAATPEKRRIVEKTWEEAVNALRAIPPDTKAAESARSLEETYRKRWEAARAGREREDSALGFLQKAGDRARKAEKAAREDRWTQSARYWRESLDFLQRVPRESLEYSRAETSIALYRKALAQASDRERISQDLQQVCSKKRDICSYEVGDERIRVYLSDRYARRVQSTALQAQERSDTKIQVDLLNHLARLESVLQAISDSAARPVEVYNADRVLLSLYEPKR